MKKHLNLTFILSVMLVISLFSCSDEDEIKLLPPTVALDNSTAIYTVKVGKSITISPLYTHNAAAIYAWKIDGKIVGEEPTFTYQANDIGDKFVSLEVTNAAGQAYIELKISAQSLLLPIITLQVPEHGYKIIKGTDFALKPTFQHCDQATFKWFVNNEQKSTSSDFTFHSETTGNYNLKIEAQNEDGITHLEIPIEVCNPEDIPFSWSFDHLHYNLSQGRRIRLAIWDIANDFDATYTWKVNGKEQQKGKETFYIFDQNEIGNYRIDVTMNNPYTEQTQSLTVTVCPPEGTYKREQNGSSQAQWNKVYEFLAASGQFVNEGYSVFTMAEATAYAEDRLKKEGYVSLGGFGGYIVLGFDHSIDNDGSYNLQIKGNSFAGSSEPGVVWVMQDENGNGQPDDTWYELKGSEYGKGREIRDYAITYYKPKAPGMSVQWTDNQGKSGVIDYLGFHQQDYYYPNWITTDRYTLRGTCLPANTRETSPGYWYNGELEWGYADNFSAIDRLTEDDNFGAGANGNHLRISDAVTFDGQPANLKYIDFVKIVTGVNCKAGWLGEISTEVFNVKDYNMLKK